LIAAYFAAAMDEEIRGLFIARVFHTMMRCRLVPLYAPAPHTSPLPDICCFATPMSAAPPVEDYGRRHARMPREVDVY